MVQLDGHERIPGTKLWESPNPVQNEELNQHNSYQTGMGLTNVQSPRNLGMGLYKF